MRKKFVKNIQKNESNQEKITIGILQPKDENQLIFDKLSKLLGKHKFSKDFVIKTYND